MSRQSCIFAYINSIMSVSISGAPVRAPYWIVDTDYDNYSLVWSCTDVLLANLEFSWILSRKRTLDDATVERLKQKLASFGVKTSGFLVTDQTNCPQF